MKKKVIKIIRELNIEQESSIPGAGMQDRARRGPGSQTKWSMVLGPQKELCDEIDRDWIAEEGCF